MSNEKKPVSDEEKAKLIKRAPNGDFLPGNQSGRLGKGVPKTNRKLERERKALERELNQKASDMALTMLNDKLGDVIDKLYEQAMNGCTKSLGLWMRHSTPVAQRSKRVDTDHLADVASLPAEERLTFINRAMLSGDIDVDIGSELLKAQKAEIDATTMMRIQKLARRVARNEVSLEHLAEEFGKIADDLPALIEGTVDEG